MLGTLGLAAVGLWTVSGMMNQEDRKTLEQDASSHRDVREYGWFGNDTADRWKVDQARVERAPVASIGMPLRHPKLMAKALTPEETLRARLLLADILDETQRIWYMNPNRITNDHHSRYNRGRYTHPGLTRYQTHGEFADYGPRVLQNIWSEKDKADPRPGRRTPIYLQ